MNNTFPVQTLNADSKTCGTCCPPMINTPWQMALFTLLVWQAWPKLSDTQNVWSGLSNYSCLFIQRGLLGLCILYKSILAWSIMQARQKFVSGQVCHELRIYWECIKRKMLEEKKNDSGKRMETRREGVSTEFLSLIRLCQAKRVKPKKVFHHIIFSGKIFFPSPRRNV